MLSLKETRLAQDLRLIDVAASAGVSVSLVSMVESGYQCSEQKRGQIAQAVGASYGSFWGEFEMPSTHMLAGAERMKPRPERHRRRGVGT